MRYSTYSVGYCWCILQLLFSIRSNRKEESPARLWKVENSGTERIPTRKAYCGSRKKSYEMSHNNSQYQPRWFLVNYI